MIKGTIKDIKKLEWAIENNVLVLIYNWINSFSQKAPTGIHKIDGKKVYANVMDEPTMLRSESIFEVHQKYIDLHYCIEGDEIIEYADAKELKKKTEFDIDKDVQLFEMGGVNKSFVELHAGEFAVLLPGEAHAPRIKFESSRIKKVVIKILKNG